MPAANHSFYLRNCYLNNNLSQGKMEIAGVTLDLKNVTVPIYNLATREDHIAPAKSVLYGSQFFGGPVNYVLAGSGHIAGVINPPGKPKYSILDRQGSERLRCRPMARVGGGAPGLVVAGLAAMAQGPGRRDSAGARDRQRQAQGHRGRAGVLCETEELDLMPMPGAAAAQ